MKFFYLKIVFLSFEIFAYAFELLRCLKNTSKSKIPISLKYTHYITLSNFLFQTFQDWPSNILSSRKIEKNLNSKLFKTKNSNKLNTWNAGIFRAKKNIPHTQNRSSFQKGIHTTLSRTHWCTRITILISLIQTYTTCTGTLNLKMLFFLIVNMKHHVLPITFILLSFSDYTSKVRLWCIVEV